MNFDEFVNIKLSPKTVVGRRCNLRSHKYNDENAIRNHSTVESNMGYS